MPPQTTLKEPTQIEASPIEENPESPTMASPCHHLALDLAHNEKSPIHPQDLEIQTFEIKPQEDSEKLKSSTRTIILALVITVLFIGRFSVPDNEPSSIQDKILDALESANKFINTPGNEIYRSAFQFICSFMVDTVFVITFGYWVVKARSVRLPLSLAVFYIIRAGIQSIHMSPFPEGYWWYSPGIPSFVVPYGRGSDFFFSGHSGFLIICACEWNKLGFKKVRNFVLGVTAYTIMILFIYRIHYTIDVFTGVFFAEWCFGKIDLVKEKIENTSSWIVSSVKKTLIPKQSIEKQQLAP